jgi:hypothetical protein
MIDPATLRRLIRDVIAEEVAALKAARGAPAPTASIPSVPATPVRLASDADLAAFARQVLLLAEQPEMRAAILAGQHRFTLAGAAPTSSPAAQAQAGGTHRVDKGIVTERLIGQLPAGITRLLLGPGVSLTPLARDKAKARHLSIERTGP